jgi:hypothetical protein
MIRRSFSRSLADGHPLRNLVFAIPTMAELKGGAHALQEVFRDDRRGRGDRYLFDEQIWENDDAADAYWANDQGSDNSVVLTG